MAYKTCLEWLRIHRAAGITEPVYIGEKSGETFNAAGVDALLAEAAADESPMASEKEKAELRESFGITEPGHAGEEG